MKNSKTHFVTKLKKKQVVTKLKTQFGKKSNCDKTIEKKK